MNVPRGTGNFYHVKSLAVLTFHFATALFAVVLLLSAIVPPVHAQPEQMAELTRRMDSLESLNLDHRLTVIETMLADLKSDHWTHLGTMAGTALLILERAARALRRDVKEIDRD